ncbi:MAG: tetratricopeptide repeat protein [Planctomycetota bacterium]|jgi:tetratricopeptide (TPR) repeat protein
MVRNLLCVAIILGSLALTGCNNPRTTDAHLLDAPAAIESDIYLAPGSGEADYVENLAAQRAAYRAALVSLRDYYRSVGNANKGQWADTELKTFDQMVHYRYLQPGEWVPENLTAMNSIEAADEMYKEAMKLYKQAGGTLIITNRPKLRQALGKFNEVIKTYPSSDKIDDAAYRAGRIYEYFKNYQLAAIYYQRTFQWNEVTPYPARYRAARVMDLKLRMRKEALELYRLSVEKEGRYLENAEYANQRIKTLSTPRPEETVEVTEETLPVEEDKVQ